MKRSGMYVRRRQAMSMVAFGLGAAAVATPLRADDYPTKPIRLVVAYGAGGANDVIARIVAKLLGEELGQQVIVANQPGAGGTVGAGAVAKAAPDGYTLLMGAGAHALAPSLYKSLPYDITKDLTAVGIAGRGGYVLSVNMELPVKTVAELVALGKQPGTNLNFVSSGVGAPPHLAGELFRAMTSANMTHVPYKAEPESLNDLMAGRVQMGFITIASATPLIKAGKLRGLAFSGATRTAILPDLPTLAESGLVGFDVSTWWGVFAPAGTPAAIVAKLHAALAKITANPEYAKLLAAQGLDVASSSSPADFAKFVASEKERYAVIAKAAGVQPE